MAHDVSALMGLVTLTFDLLTLKLVCESHLRWGKFLPNLGTLGLWVLELFAMYATYGRTKARLNAPFPTGGGITGLVCQMFHMCEMEFSKIMFLSVDMRNPAGWRAIAILVCGIC